MRILMLTGKPTDFHPATSTFPTDYSGWFILREVIDPDTQSEELAYHKVHYRYDQDMDLIRAIAAGYALIYAEDFWPRRDPDGVPHPEAFEMHAKVITATQSK